MPHFLNQPLRLAKVAAALLHAHRLAHALAGAQVFAQAFAVVANQMVSAIQNMRITAVVFLQLDLLLHCKFAHEIGHIAHTSTPEGINALVVIAHSEHAGHMHHTACTSVGMRMRMATRQRLLGAPACKHLQPGVLQLVGVLEFVHQNMPKAPRVVLTHARIVTQQLVAAQHQLAKIHHAFALALLLVERIKLCFFACFFVTSLNI